MEIKNIITISLLSFISKALADCSFATKDGYKCCSGCNVVLTDSAGKWGEENNEWCGIDDSKCSGSSASCWSLALGYNCCGKGTATVFTDKDGSWGIEDNEWCGISDSTVVDPVDPNCWASAEGYPCCTTCEAILTDGQKKWGFENNNWCGILSTCTNPPTTTTVTTTTKSSTNPEQPTQPAVPSGNDQVLPGYLSTSGKYIVDQKGRKVRLAGLSWFGGETTNLSPHGLWAKPLQHFIDVLVKNGYNHLRYPWTNEMFFAGAKTESVDSMNNPDLADLSPLEVMDAVIEAAGKAGLKIYLDRHRPLSGGQSELWYIDDVPEEKWIEDWVFLAKRYKGNPTVIGADLHNEPHGKACWGCGEENRDWRLAAERCGNAILKANPDWLIIVEGNDHYGEEGWQKGESYWWGGMLKGVHENPVRLDVPNKLVYSAHDYDKNVFNQDWFKVSEFPDNMPEVWDDKWGFIAKENIAPVLISEFGTVLRDEVDAAWLKKFVKYMLDNDIHWTFWCLNPNSGDTGGILKYDWETIETEKDDILTPMKAPDFLLK